jgi:8-amino-7-oxononanoate synthase
LLARTFFETLVAHPLWLVARKKGLLDVPLADGWEDRQFLTHIVTIWTRQKYLYWIYMHLLSASFFVLPVQHPVVPSGQSRLRVTFHAGNTTAQIVSFVEQIFVWVEEIMAIEDGRSGMQVTKAAKEVYKWMEREGLHGFGMA